MNKPTYYENEYEHSLVYQRGDERVELALVHLPGTKSVLNLATFPAQADPDAEPEPSSLIEFSEEEIAMRSQFVTHLREAGLL